MKPGGTVALCQRLRVATSDLRAPGAARSIRFPGVTSWAVGWGSMGEVLWRLVQLGALVLVEVGGRKGIQYVHVCSVAVWSNRALWLASLGMG